jgi:membrane protein implicated in regulation of membrane protease activity
MLTIYWVCFIVGGVFVLLAVLGGLDGVDFDHDFDLDHGLDLDHVEADVELTEPSERPQRSRWLWFSLLKSVKFWTFSSCFFGLTGVVLSGLNLPPLLVLLLAVGMGLICGTAIAATLRLLYRRQVDSLARTTDLVGLTGTVELPFDPDSRGKVRLQVKGTTIDFIAYTDEKNTFQRGDLVLVVGTDQNRLWVVSAEGADSSR